MHLTIGTASRHTHYLYAAIWEFGVCESRDAGESWHKLADGPDGEPLNINALAISHVTSDILCNQYVLRGHIFFEQFRPLTNGTVEGDPYETYKVQVARLLEKIGRDHAQYQDVLTHQFGLRKTCVWRASMEITNNDAPNEPRYFTDSTKYRFPCSASLSKRYKSFRMPRD